MVSRRATTRPRSWLAATRATRPAAGAAIPCRGRTRIRFGCCRGDGIAAGQVRVLQGKCECCRATASTAYQVLRTETDIHAPGMRGRSDLEGGERRRRLPGDSHRVSVRRTPYEVLAVVCDWH